ncbi:hypothetical protein TNIN_75481 [Trichonephila inaurata madagascariensis]|uniref:Uncharacterized protein n=1 Tax=Trichonephila inaurata madagascariensis TaxID=2747483 RepID=A0A8X6WX02_9ARAC|nr:hypothetical protein TNIN_75481 [Trichonephila inaurata madagascariensis]
MSRMEFSSDSCTPAVDSIEQTYAVQNNGGVFMLMDFPGLQAKKICRATDEKFSHDILREQAPWTPWGEFRMTSAIIHRLPRNVGTRFGDRWEPVESVSKNRLEKGIL